VGNHNHLKEAGGGQEQAGGRGQRIRVRVATTRIWRRKKAGNKLAYVKAWFDQMPTGINWGRKGCA